MFDRINCFVAGTCTGIGAAAYIWNKIGFVGHTEISLITPICIIFGLSILSFHLYKANSKSRQTEN